MTLRREYRRSYRQILANPRLARDASTIKKMRNLERELLSVRAAYAWDD